MPEIVSLSDAVRLGRTKYFTGKPCKNGHLSERRTESYHCMECASLASMASGKKDLPRRRAHNATFRAKNPDYIRTIKKQHRLDNAAQYRANDFRRKYGLTLEERDQMFEAQGSCCAVCRATEPGGGGWWHTDHCHKTNKVRGVLCHPCNTALGLARDSVSILESMIAYLERHSDYATGPARVAMAVGEAQLETRAVNQ